MASVSQALPKLLRWVFTVLVVFTAFIALVACVLMLINPHIPPTAHFGPIHIDFAGQPGFVALRPAGGDLDFMMSAFRGSVTLVVHQARGFIDVVKRFLLPLWLVRMLFFTALFELLRRLFRNVGRGDSFTPNTVRLVQILGGLLIAFAYILSFGDGLLEHAIFSYFAQHAVVTVSGSQVHLPQPRYVMLPHGGFLPVMNPLFFSGLLVLALSEVFRQGVALKKDSELTI
jgi:hypothetical protein